MQMEPDAARVHNLDIPHARFKLPGCRALVTEEAEFDIVGGEGVAIVEGDPSTQEKLALI